MQQQMLLVDAEVIQGMYDSFSAIITQQLSQVDKMLINLQNNISSLKSVEKLQMTQQQT